MNKILLSLFLVIALMGTAWANNGWYSTLQGTASDVEQTTPPNGVTIAYNTTDHQWEFNYGLAPAGGTTGTCLEKNSNSDYDYSWVTCSSSQWTLSGSNLYPNSQADTVTVGESTVSEDVFTTNANGVTGNGIAVNYIPNSVNGTGGTITTVGGNQINTFTSSGTFTPTNSGTVNVLVVGGGAGGGADGTYTGGGGGGGGVISTTYAVTSGTPITVTIGSGGAANNNGGNSVFGSLTAVGGGTQATLGGSGGGGSGSTTSGGAGTGSQGNAGGTGTSANAGVGGGGGGYNSVGGNASSSTAGNGGGGFSSSISGASYNYACGGGGGANSNAPSSAGSGGCVNAGSGSATHSAASAASGYGSGGGGGGCGGGSGCPGGEIAGAGYQGIVIVSYTSPAAVPEYLLENNGTQTAKIWTDGNNSSRFDITIGSSDFLQGSTSGIPSFPQLTSNGIMSTSGGTGLVGITATTGSGNVVLATSPTITSPAISGNLTYTGRIVKRSNTYSNATSITPNSDNDDISYMANTEGAGTFTVNNDAGTNQVNGQSWVLKMSSTSVQTFSWGTQYDGGTLGLPTATLGTSTLQYFCFVWDSVSSKWDYTGNVGGF